MTRSNARFNLAMYRLAELNTFLQDRVILSILSEFTNHKDLSKIVLGAAIGVIAAIIVSNDAVRRHGHGHAVCDKHLILEALGEINEGLRDLHHQNPEGLRDIREGMRDVAYAIGHRYVVNRHGHVHQHRPRHHHGMYDN